MILRTMLVAAAAAFLVLLGLTLLTDGTAGMNAVTAATWGRVLLADFYLGVLCFAAVIWAVERALFITLAWTVALALLGFPVAVVWLLLRGLPVIGSSAAADVAKH
ncbi:MAG: hypothetical protein EA417_00800 [Gammaproteobacteria bacterium]|nr:MAG: hypothetical protein EA417_00800 [Gammaproteobacteria bacterium]